MAEQTPRAVCFSRDSDLTTRWMELQHRRCSDLIGVDS